MVQSRGKGFFAGLLGNLGFGLRSRSGSAASGVRQVVRCAVDGHSPASRYPTLAAMRAATDVDGFIPAALVAQKAKAVADGVVAALETLSTEGTPACMGVDAFLTQLGTRLILSEEAGERIQAALDLAAGIAPRGIADPFLATSVESKPLGFYTWGPDLTRVFQRDRFLQGELDEPVAEAIWEAIHGDPRLLPAYKHHLGRVARLTNVLSLPSLLRRAELRAQGRWPLPPPERSTVAVFPPSAAPENDFASIADFFAAVRAGKLSLDTSAESGFYVHQLRALDPLLRPAAFPEAPMRLVDATYAEELAHFAGANLFFARETHVKQLELAPALALVELPRVYPEMKLEPLPSYYAFLADAFRFLRVVVAEGWGPDALAAPQRRESGSIDATVGQGIDDLVETCETAARLSGRELKGDPLDAEMEASRARLFGLWTDTDAVGDARGMVPLGHANTGMLRVLVFAGWEVHTLRIELLHLAERPPETALGAVAYPLPVPLVRETIIPVNALLDRDEVRRVCDAALGVVG